MRRVEDSQEKRWYKFHALPNLQSHLRTFVISFVLAVIQACTYIHTRDSQFTHSLTRRCLFFLTSSFFNSKRISHIHLIHNTLCQRRSFWSFFFFTNIHMKGTTHQSALLGVHKTERNNVFWNGKYTTYIKL